MCGIWIIIIWSSKQLIFSLRKIPWLAETDWELLSDALPCTCALVAESDVLEITERDSEAPYRRPELYSDRLELDGIMYDAILKTTLDIDKLVETEVSASKLWLHGQSIWYVTPLD